MIKSSAYFNENALARKGVKGFISKIVFPNGGAKYLRDKTKRHYTVFPDLDNIVEKDIQRLFDQSSEIDTIVLACTHYPLLLPVISQYVPENVTILSQGELVANKLTDYLHRHPEVETQCSKNGHLTFYTTDDAKSFEANTTIFYGQKITASHLDV